MDYLKLDLRFAVRSLSRRPGFTTACDDDVLTSGSSPADHAEDLAALARSLRPAPAAYVAIAMARPAYLKDRVHALLDDERRRGRVWLAHTLAASAAALLVVVPLAAMVPVAGDRVEVTAAAVPSAVRKSPIPALPGDARRDRERPQTICWGRNDDVPKVHVERRHDSYLLEWETVGCEVQVRIRREIEFNSDFTAIARIARGGSVRLIEEEGSTERRLDIEPGPEGLEYTWRVDDREAPFDAAASDWLSEMLLQIFRSAGYAANERSLWFLREHGMPGLLQEIDQLPSSVLADSELGNGDHILRVYYQVALEQGDVDATGAAQLIRRAGAHIRSDRELSGLLRAAGKRFGFNDTITDAFLEGARTFESDHERLAAVLERASLDAERGSRDAVAALGRLLGVQVAHLGVSLDSDAATDSIGARIRDVLDDGPAETAGLRAGDIITAIDGRSIARRDANDARPDEQLRRRLRGIEPGDTVRLDYRRNSQPLAANVDVPNVWRAEWRDGALRLGPNAALELAEMNEALGDYFGVDHGVLVIDVRSDSRLGLEPGDVILRIGDRDVRDARDARSTVASYHDDAPIQIEIMRDRQRQTITGQGS